FVIETTEAGAGAGAGAGAAVGPSDQLLFGGASPAPLSTFSSDDMESGRARSLSPLSSAGFNDMLFDDGEAAGGDFAFPEGGFSFTDFDEPARDRAARDDVAVSAFDSLVDFDADPSFALAPDFAAEGSKDQLVKVEGDKHNNTSSLHVSSDTALVGGSGLCLSN
ncbi:hypothetical protein KEM52_000595, partial [Ascosphaera acerosa]